MGHTVTTALELRRYLASRPDDTLVVIYPESVIIGPDGQYTDLGEAVTQHTIKSLPITVEKAVIDADSYVYAKGGLHHHFRSQEGRVCDWCGTVQQY